MNNDENKSPQKDYVSPEEEKRRLELLYGPKQPGQEIPEEVVIEKIVVEVTDEEVPENKNGSSSDDEPVDDNMNLKFREANNFLMLVLNPFVLPTILMLLIFKLSILDLWVDNELVTKFLMIVAGATFALPIILLFLLKTGGMVKNFTLSGRLERICPYIVEIFAFGGISWFLYTMGFPNWAWLIYIGMTACALVNFAINFKFKISCQASAMAALIASFLIINNDGLVHPSMMWWVIGSVLLLGVSGSLSILAKRHTVPELLAGYATGFLAVFLFSLAA